MKHFAAPDFWDCYRTLPVSVQELADKNFSLLKKDMRHPSLQVKKVGKYWSARVGLYYRTLAIEAQDGLVWFWIGSHTEYDNLIR